MTRQFCGASVLLAVSILCAIPVAAQEGRGRGQGGQGGQGAPGGRQGGRGNAGTPCVNEWKLANGCDPARARPATLDPHDLTGVWSRSRGASSMGNEVDATMTPEGKAAFDANKPSFGRRAVAPALGNDPMGKCDPLGLTRNVFLEVAGRGFEFAMEKDRVIQMFEWAHSYRTIWLDGRALPKDPEPRWMGYSVGHWEGNTLVVETVGLEPRTWVDNIGHAHSERAQIQERYTRTAADQMQYSMTLTDPTFYRQPFVSDTKTLALNFEKSLDEKFETFCVPSEEQAFNESIRNPAAKVK